MRHADGLQADMNGAMASVDGKFTIVSPELSEFSEPSDITQLMGNAAARLTTKRPDAIQQIIVKGHSHAILTSNAGVIPQATLYKIAKQK